MGKISSVTRLACRSKISRPQASATDRIVSTLKTITATEVSGKMASQKDKQVVSAMSKLAPVIRASAGLASNDLNFYKSLDQSIAQHSDSSSAAILKLVNDLVSSVDSTDINDVDDKMVKESWSVLSNMVDSFLERSDIAFDGLRKTSSGESPAKQVTYLDDSSSIPSNTATPKRQDKPQTRFKTAIDNNESHPFKPLLTSKPHALTPLEEAFQLTEAEEHVPGHYKQPYETEILTQSYNDEILEKREPQPYTNWESTDAVWVDSVEVLKEMLEQLEQATEIAVDLEHHDYRSYYGIVCLMQISTRDQDWLVDTLALREDLQVLNSVFSNPMITKVFHGAFMDIIWLQRDLGLYVVGLFDTYHASRQLGFPKHSLAYLLERFAHFKTSKKYQLADWRIRPLTRPMRAYARSDTHFLLYIYDELRIMLLEASKMEKVLFESRNVAVRRYEYSRFRPTNNQPNVVSLIEKADPWKSLLYQYNLPTSREKVVQALYEWRDNTARKEDESPRYIMSNQVLVSLASLAPTDAAGVLSSSTTLTESVRKNCKHIADLIAQSLKDTELEDIQLMNDATTNVKHHEEEELTLDAVLTGEALFRSITEFEGAFAHFKKQSQVMSRNMLNQPTTIQYSRGQQLSEAVPRDAEGRRYMVERLLNKFTNAPTLPSVELDAEPEAIVADTETPSVAVPADDLDGNEKEVEGPSDMFNNSEDIIVLKQKQKQNKQNKRIDKRGEAFDYDSAEKVIQEPTRQRREKKRPSTKFDPYTKESEGPKPAKKQSKPQQGKTASFFEKKRRC